MRFTDMFRSINTILPKEIYEKHCNFILLIDWLRYKFSRNVFRSRSVFSNKNHATYNFDYEYTLKNNTHEKLLDIQKKIMNYHNLYKSKKMDDIIIGEYNSFMDDSLQLITSNIVNSIYDIPLHLQLIINKYKTQLTKKSPNINYEALKLII